MRCCWPLSAGTGTKLAARLCPRCAVIARKRLPLVLLYIQA